MSRKQITADTHKDLTAEACVWGTCAVHGCSYAGCVLARVSYVSESPHHQHLRVPVESCFGPQSSDHFHADAVAQLDLMLVVA